MAHCGRRSSHVPLDNERILDRSLSHLNKKGLYVTIKQKTKDTQSNTTDGTYCRGCKLCSDRDALCPEIWRLPNIM